MVIIHSKVNSVALKTRSINDISSSHRNILLSFKLSSWVRNTFGEGWYFSTGVVWGYIMNFISKSTVGFQILEPVGMLECPVVPQSVSQSDAGNARVSESGRAKQVPRYSQCQTWLTPQEGFYNSTQVIKVKSALCLDWLISKSWHDKSVPVVVSENSIQCQLKILE